MIARIPFAGFYETLHDHELDDALNQMLSDESGNPNENLVARAYDLVDWHAAQTAYAKAYAENFCAEFKIEATFESMTSPREYNFETDKVWIEMTETEARRILGETNDKSLRDTAKEMFTSRSGFISFYSPDIDTWGDIAEWDHNHLYCLLSAYAEQETDHSDGFDSWAELDLMEHDRGNGEFENMIYNDKLERLCKINDYLRQRESRSFKVYLAQENERRNFK